MKIRHDMVEKKLVPGWGEWGEWGGVRWVLAKFKEWLKPFNCEKHYRGEGFFII